MQNNIIISNQKSETLFSTGILVQSLMSVGMNMDDAIKFSMTFRRDLLDRNMHRIDLSKLEHLIEDELKQQNMIKVAQRYRKLREVKNSSRPVVIFVGGATGSGKSTLATEIAHRFRFNRILSTDAIRSVMRAIVSPELLPSVHKSSFEAWKDQPYPFSDKVDPVIASFVDQASKVSIAVKAIVDRAIKENLQTVIEGVHLLPGMLEAYRSNDDLYKVHIMVGVSDVQEHRQRFEKRGKAQEKRPGKRYLDNFEAIRKIHDYLLVQAEQQKVKTFKDLEFNQLIQEATGYILDNW